MVNLLDVGTVLSCTTIPSSVNVISEALLIEAALANLVKFSLVIVFSTSTDGSVIPFSGGVATILLSA